MATNAGLIGAGAIGAVGSLANTALGYFTGKAASRDQYWHQRKLMGLQYKYQQLNYKQAPSAQREGLETAGYNPILAVNNGMSYSAPGLGSASIGDYGSNSDIGSSIANAYQTFNLNKQQVQSQTALNESTKDLNTANAALTRKKEITEGLSQTGIAIDNEIKSIEKSIRQKDLDTYDTRFANDLIEQLSRTKLNYASASASAIQAEAARIGAGAQVTNARTQQIVADVNNQRTKQEILRNSGDAEWAKKHPKQASFLSGLHRYTSAVSPIFGGSASFSYGRSKSNSDSKSTVHSHSWKH